MSQDGKRALIIGGSLAGLFNAIALRAVGWEVEVFERTPHPLSSRGGGIVLQPEVVQILSIAGLASDIPLGVEATERLYLEEDGSIDHHLPMRQLLTSWPMLYNLARQAVPNALYHLNARLTGFEEVGDKVTAIFADGRRSTGDLLIGADGVNSTVRALKLPDVEPVYAGYIAWRGLVAETRFHGTAADLLRERFVFNHLHNSHILDYLIPAPNGATEPGKRSFNWVWYRNVPEPQLLELLTDCKGRVRRTSVPPGLVRAQAVATMKQDARELLAPQMADLVAATHEPFIQTILDVTVPKMVFDRILLTGDAAFVPRPHTAASTSKAASNAIALAAALGSSSNLDTALAAWEHDQLQLGNTLYRQGRSLGNRSQFPERFAN